jgi:hypothetical protein
MLLPRNREYGGWTAKAVLGSVGLRENKVQLVRTFAACPVCAPTLVTDSGVLLHLSLVWGMASW